MSNLADEQHVKFSPSTATIHRECWVTMWRSTAANADLIIGAGTKEACIRAFELLSGHKCDGTIVYAATIVATKDGIQPFRALAPEQSIFCTCIVGTTRPTEHCEIHGGHFRGYF